MLIWVQTRFLGASVLNNSNLLAAAEAAMASGDLVLAERLCLKIAPGDPGNAGAKRLSGIIAARKGQPERAIEILEEVLVSEEDDLEVRYWLAVSQRSLHQFEKAAKNFMKASELDPRRAVIHHDLGLCLSACLDFDGAILAFQKAIDLNPEIAPLRHSLGSAYQSLGRYREAAEAFNSAITLAPNDIQGYIAMAQLALEMPDKKSAAWYFRKAYELEPSSFRGQLQLAHALFEEHSLAEAESCLRALIQKFPDRPTALGLLGRILLDLGRFEEANEVTMRAIKLDPFKTAFYTQYVTQKKMSESDIPLIDSMNRLVREPRIGDLGAKDLYFAIGKSMNDLKKYEKAMEAFDKGNALAYGRLAPETQIDRIGYVRGLERVMAFYNADYLKKLSSEVGSSSNRPIFIVGMVRSGTTLLDQILSSHQKIGSAGELSFWLEKGHEVSQPDGTYSAPSHLSDEYLELLLKHDAVSERVVDKMPTNYLNLGMIHAYFPEARILHSKRHPIDNCVSIYTTPGLPPSYAHNKDDIVFVYERYQRLMDYWTRTLPANRMMSVQYEELLSDPEDIIKGVLSFCGLEWDPACLEHDQNAKSIATPSAWQARQPIYKTSMERWRNYEPWLGSFAKLMPE